jgi:predicted O-methyltransferase YrrM
MAQIEASGETLEEAAARLVAVEAENYRTTYRDHADHFLAVSPAYGRFLYAIARARRAKRIVELGTSMGISTIYLAAALRDMPAAVLASTRHPNKRIALHSSARRPLVTSP